MKIARRSRSRKAYRSRKAGRSRKACRKAGRSRKYHNMIGGISGNKTRLITVNDPFDGILFQDDINNDHNPETFIMKHPSNKYKDGIRAGKYEIMKIDDNHPEFGLLYAIIVTGSMDDLNRRLAALMDD